MPPRNRRPRRFRNLGNIYASTEEITSINSDETATDDVSTALQDSRPSSPRDSFCCFNVTLGSNDVTEAFLGLDKAKAVKLMSDPETVAQYKENDLYVEGIGDPITMYDDQNNVCNMQLTVSCFGITPLFSLQGDWNRFVRTHQAKPGEVVTFLRSSDEDSGYRYVIRVSKRSRIIRREKKLPNMSMMVRVVA